MTKKKLTSVLQILVPLFSTLFIFLVATLIIIYANGYKINFTTKKVIKTGTINVSTKPSGASIYLDDQLVNRSNTILPDVVTGLHHVKIEKDGYFPYQRDIYVEHGYAYTIAIPLIKQTSAQDFSKLADTPELEILNIIDSTNALYIIAQKQEENLQTTPSVTTTKTPTPSPTATQKTKNENKEVIIYKIDINKRFFIEKNYNLHQVVSINMPKDSEISEIIPINKDGLILKVSQDKKTHYYLIGSNELKETINIADLTPDKTLDYYTSKGFSIQTDPHCYYILLTSPDKIISYNPQNLQKTIIYEKIDPNDQFIWSYTSDDIFIITQKKVSNPTPTDQQDKNKKIDSTLQTTIIAKKYDGRLDDDYNFPEDSDLDKIIYLKAVDTNDGTVLIFSDKNGTFLLGSLFTDSGKKITTESTRIREYPIKHYPEESISRLQIFDAPISSFILNAPIDQIIFTDQEKHNLYKFKYNKDQLDHDEKLGLIKLKNSDNKIELVQNVKNPEYVLIYESAQKDNAVTYNISIKTVHGDNEYNLVSANITHVKTFLHGSVILYTTPDKQIFIIETD